MFSYEEYRQIVGIIKESGKSATFPEAIERECFIIMRHDVEFSVDRAFQLARLEQDMNFRSTYFFQWTNNSYNILSKKNTDMINEMHKEGHEIGLHYALNGLTDIAEIKEKILLEIQVLSSMLGFEINTFSFHRPPAEILKANIRFENIINAYQDDFFTFAKQVEEGTKLDVKYLSDAQHRWNYGIPDQKTLSGNQKVQVLTHPYSWTETGYDNLHNFRSLIQERNQELIHSIDDECKHFAAVKEQI